LGEALARCPTLRLVAPDPAGVADAWDRLLERLEGIGAAVESERSGAAWFEARGLRRLHGGDLDGVLNATRRALKAPARLGAAAPRARELARGHDTPLRPRSAAERLEEALELPESASGPQLERALGLLIDRLLARHERRGRTLRAVVLSALLVGGGTWRAR